MIDLADNVSSSSLPRRSSGTDRQSFDDSAVLESSLRPSDMDLLSDPDILKICKKSYSLEDLNIISSPEASSVATDSENDVSVSWVSHVTFRKLTDYCKTWAYE